MDSFPIQVQLGFANGVHRLAGTVRRKRMDRTFKAIEDMGLAVQAHFKTFFVCVPTYLTLAGRPITLKQIRAQICRVSMVDSLFGNQFFNEILYRGLIHPQTDRLLVNLHYPLDRDELDLLVNHAA